MIKNILEYSRPSIFEHCSPSPPTFRLFRAPSPFDGDTVCNFGLAVATVIHLTTFQTLTLSFVPLARWKQRHPGPQEKRKGGGTKGVSVWWTRWAEGEFTECPTRACKRKCFAMKNKWNELIPSLSVTETIKFPRRSNEHLCTQLSLASPLPSSPNYHRLLPSLSFPPSFPSSLLPPPLPTSPSLSLWSLPPSPFPLCFSLLTHLDQPTPSALPTYPLPSTSFRLSVTTGAQKPRCFQGLPRLLGFSLRRSRVQFECFESRSFPNFKVRDPLRNILWFFTTTVPQTRR